MSVASVAASCSTDDLAMTGPLTRFSVQVLLSDSMSNGDNSNIIRDYCQNEAADTCFCARGRRLLGCTDVP